jgi:hypothetical protein
MGVPEWEYFNNQHQIPIYDNKHLPYVQSYHKYCMPWCGTVLDRHIICPKI